MKALPRQFQQWLGASLRHTGLSHLVIKVRQGPLQGFRWTLYPRTSYWRGTHEPEIARFISAVPGLEGQTAWDLGAHYGYYSVLLAAKTGPTGRVDAFEPNPFSFRKLRRHAALNHMPWLHVHEVAVGVTRQAIEMLSYQGSDDTASHLAYTGEDTNRAPHRWQVAMCQLDEEVAAARLEPPRFIKLDVEGYGHHAIAGARNSISTSLPLIVAGLHSHEESAGIDDILLPLGYRKCAPAGEAIAYETGQLDVIYQPANR